MAREKRIFFNVPALYKRQALDHLMFGYVHGVKRAVPSATIKDCILMFMEDNELPEDSYSLETAMRTFQRMAVEYRCT